ncbi:hypothetical protein NQ318_000360 [Aromia moschata]|uniref:Uncharacterized protein n=1 Tax=Aromia moschata TaxID=1265417 RepID=A0AAV8X9C9_9CUCU|nr:hypothetical protein NQ318_000360 [Aromia moschata]
MFNVQDQLDQDHLEVPVSDFLAYELPSQFKQPSKTGCIMTHDYGLASVSHRTVGLVIHHVIDGEGHTRDQKDSLRGMGLLSQDSCSQKLRTMGLIGVDLKLSAHEAQIYVVSNFVDTDPIRNFYNRLGETDLGKSRSEYSAVKILKKKCSIHYTPIQKLLPQDSPARLQFTQFLQNLQTENLDFLLTILFTDEAIFTRRGVFN